MFDKPQRLRKMLRSLNQKVRDQVDRKSTRLNSSHSHISYAVFCLKTKSYVYGASPHYSGSLAEGHISAGLATIQRTQASASHELTSMLTTSKQHFPTSRDSQPS